MMSKDNISGTLFVLATPIGNLGDITFRCIETLKAVDIIASEDTRTAKKLLNHFNINPPILLSYEEHNEDPRSDEIIRHLKSGKSIALISEGGTPLISDPGYRIVSKVISEGLRIVPVPGVSAVTAALSVSGCGTERFSFLGFLPRKAEERLKFIKKISRYDHTVVIFESPHRIDAALSDFNETLPGRLIVLCRELTKIHEEFIRGTAEEILSIIKEKGGLKGEITLIIAKPSAETKSPDITLPVDDFCDLLTAQAGMPPSKAASIIAKLCKSTRNEIYNKILKKNRRS
jgi:16S rRNA (cytidine1402-2'-O)-methyltransferase